MGSTSVELSDETRACSTTSESCSFLDTPRGRFVEAMRAVLSAESESTGGSRSEKKDYPSGWLARLNHADQREMREITTAQEYIASTGTSALVEWMLGRLASQTREARRTQRETVFAMEKNLAHVRAAHATKLRALDARHRDEIQSWRVGELASARNAAIEAVAKARDEAEQIVEAVGAELAKMAQRAIFAESKAVSLETTSSANVANAALVTKTHRERDARKAHAMTKFLRSRNARQKRQSAFHKWREVTNLARAATETKRCADHEKKAHQSTCSLRRADACVDAVLALARCQRKMAALNSSGRFIFSGWRRVAAFGKRKRLDEADAAAANARAAKRFVADLYAKRALDTLMSKLLVKSLDTWRAVTANAIGQREAHELLRRKTTENVRDSEIKALARAFLWRLKWTKRKVLRVWCALKNSAAKRDATLVQTLLRMIDQIKLKCSVAKWVAFVTCRRQRTREITHAVGVVFKKRSALRRWRENVVALRSRKQKIIQNFVVDVLERSLPRRPQTHRDPFLGLRVLERVVGTERALHVNLWRRVLDPNDAVLRGQTLGNNNRGRVLALVGKIKQASRFRNAHVHASFKSWRRESNRSREHRVTLLRRVLVLVPTRAYFSRWVNALRVSRRKTLAASRTYKARTQRAALLFWWLTATEAAERGADSTNSHEKDENATTEATSTQDKPQQHYQKTLLSLQWETPRGRPVNHWLGKALGAAARLGVSSGDDATDTTHQTTQVRVGPFPNPGLVLRRDGYYLFRLSARNYVIHAVLQD